MKSSVPAASTAYPGGELPLFQHAHRWKAYFGSQMRPFVRGDVAEVGAGLGATARILCDGTQRSWTAIEPDPALAEHLQADLAPRHRGTHFQVVVGTIGDLAADARFDTILYVDVLEHIEKDGDEMVHAAAHLSPGGHLVVLAPAHPFLFTEFDRAIGHYRRYTARTLASVVPAALTRVRLRYLDSVGVAASLANRAWLRRSLPTPRQIEIWDRWMVPTSRGLDRWLGYRLGKSVLGVWQRP